MLAAAILPPVNIDQPVLVSIGIFVVYMLVVGVVWRATRTQYDLLVDTREHVVKGIILPIGLGALFLAIATTWLGWWQLALFEDSRSGPTWALIVPILFGLVALINIASIDFRSPKAPLLPLVLVGTLLVGFAEELATRGVLVVGLREGGSSELTVWLVTSVLFALLHAMNALFGQSIRITVTQMVMSFFAGTALFVTLLTTGNLLVGMILHALWDFGTLGITRTQAQQKPVAGILGLATFAVAFVAVWFVVASS